MRLLIFYIFILFFVNNLFASEKIRYLEDMDSKTIEQVSLIDFDKNITNSFSLGFKKNPIWFKIQIQNDTNNEDFILSLNEGFYEEADLYYYEDNKWICIKNSMFIDVDKRDVKTRALSYNIKIKPNTSKVYYLKLNGKYGFFGKIEINELQSFYFKRLLNIEGIYLFVFGIVFMISIYNLFIYLNTKEKIYGYYFGYSLCYLIYLVNISGMLAYVNLQYYVYKIHIFGAIALIFLILFTSELFDIKKYSKVLNFLKYFFIIGLGILSVLLLFSYQPWNKLLNLLASIANLYLLIVAVLFLMKGYYKAIYYLLAYTTFLGLLFLFILLSSGSVEYNFINRYGFVFGGIFEMIVFSIILSNKYAQLKTQKIDAQQKLIKFNKNKEKELILLVDEKTKKLQSQEEKLKVLLSEREEFLKEIRHRVKNNFHTLIGMLWLESKEDLISQKVYIFILNRIKTISLIYDYMYSSENLEKIDVKEYIQKIISNLQFYIKDMKIDTYIFIDINFHYENLISIGMLINELINNFSRKNQNIEIIMNLINIDNNVNLVISCDKLVTYDENSLSYKIIREYTSKLKDVEYDMRFEDDKTIFELKYKE